MILLGLPSANEMSEIKTSIDSGALSDTPKLIRVKETI